MTDGVDGTILVINSGSSSVKFALLDLATDEPRRVWQGALERIGFDAGRFAATDVRGTILIDETLAIPNHAVALDLLLGWVEDRMSQKDLIAVGHRVVHGGEECDCSLLVTPALEARLKRLIPLAPRKGYRPLGDVPGACRAPMCANRERWHANDMSPERSVIAMGEGVSDGLAGRELGLGPDRNRVRRDASFRARRSRRSRWGR